MKRGILLLRLTGSTQLGLEGYVLKIGHGCLSVSACVCVAVILSVCLTGWVNWYVILVGSLGMSAW